MSQELAKSIIGTRRLVLRPLRESDAAAIFALFNDWDVVRWLSSPPWPYTRADADRYVRAAMAATDDGAETVFAITLQDRLIGSIGADEASARMRCRPTPVHWKPHFSSTRRDAGLVTRAPACNSS